MAVVSVGLEKEPDRLRFKLVMAEAPTGVLEELARFRFGEVVALVSVGLQKEPERLRWT